MLNLASRQAYVAHAFGARAIPAGTAPATLYAALISGAADPLTGGSEPVGNGYARVAIPNDATTFGAADADAKVATIVAFNFPLSTAAWLAGANLETIRFYDAAAGGNAYGGALLTDDNGDPAPVKVDDARQSIVIPIGAALITVANAD